MQIELCQAPLHCGALNVFLAVACKCLCHCPAFIKAIGVVGVFFSRDGGKGVVIDTLTANSFGGLLVAVQLVAAVCGESGGDVDIFTNERPAGTVVSLEELVHVAVVFFLAHVGVPHQLSQQIRAQFAKLTRSALAVALREHRNDVVFGKESHVLLNGEQICVGGDVIVEVRGVIPNVNVITDLTPTDDVLIELLSFGTIGVAHRVCKAALDGAKTNANVFAGLYLGGGRLGVLICKGVNDKVGIIGLQLLCDLINEGDPNAGVVAAVLLRYLCTVGAVAGLLVVRLRDRNDIDSGICLKLLANVCNDGCIDFGVGQAGVGRVYGIGIGRVRKDRNGVNEQMPFFKHQSAL